MGFKKQRLGPRLVQAARSGLRYGDAHMFVGGTGAVGGTALLQMLSLYEEMFSIREPRDEEVPVLVATGTTGDEIAAFTRRLFRFIESRHGSDLLPQRIRRGYLTHSGVFVALERFEVAALPGAKRVSLAPPEGRGAAVDEFLESLGVGRDDVAETVHEALAKAVASSRPFTEFLTRYRGEHLERLGIDRFRSILVGIPIPSLIAYQQDELLHVIEQVPGLGPDHADELKARFVEAIRDDLVHVQDRLADTLMVAHTTGVGGMYDETPGAPTPTIRLGFAHAALDRQLGEKARFAEGLSRVYSVAGIKVLVTAAAIGIDEVRVRKEIPLHRAIRQRLFDAPEEMFPGSKESQPAASRATQAAGRPVPARRVIRVFPPVTVPWEGPGSEPVTFERGEPVVPSYAIRSGENGFFSVANADTLYRVMRVASANELGLMLATVGVLGDDELQPWFSDNVCYYSETDNGRQVLDFLRQPALLQTQLSGLEPMSLQDLGSAKLQAETHTLALLILLHRLQTLDVDALDPYVDLGHFDARGFFLHHSRVLTFEDVAAWDFDDLVRGLQTLAGAERPGDLLSLLPRTDLGVFPNRRQALDRVLAQVLRGVWQIPSLGLPLLLERDGQTVLRTGYYAAPLDLLVTDTGSVDRWLREEHERSGNPCPFADFRDYHVAVGGFLDLRRDAVVCSARSDREDLTGRIVRAGDQDQLRAALHSLEPYSFFATSGILALWFRLRALYRLLREAMIELGSLHDWRWQMPRDEVGHIVLVPGIVEALRHVAEGLEKSTGTERLDGIWGYERRPVPDRRGRIPGLPAE